MCRAISQAVTLRLPTAKERTNPSAVYVGFVMDQVTMGQVFLRVLPFPLPTSFHQSSTRTHLLHCAILTTDSLIKRTLCVCVCVCVWCSGGCHVLTEVTL
jgi:hypothetical protein